MEITKYQDCMTELFLAGSGVISAKHWGVIGGV